MKIFLVVLFGGCFVVLSCTMVLYFYGKTTEEITEALLLIERPRPALNIPIGYILMMISSLVLLYEIFLKGN